MVNCIKCWGKRRKITTAFDFPFKEAMSEYVLEARQGWKEGLHRI